MYGRIWLLSWLGLSASGQEMYEAAYGSDLHRICFSHSLEVCGVIYCSGWEVHVDVYGHDREVYGYIYGPDDVYGPVWEVMRLSMVLAGRL